MSATAERRFTLTMPHYRKTQEGAEMIASQKVFCLGGNLFQGYNGTVIDVDESQVSDEEIFEVRDGARDVDNSLDKVLAKRHERLNGRQQMKDAEYAKRQAVKRAALRDELELRKLQRELGDEDTGTPPMETGVEAGPIPCEHCGKTFPNVRALQGHKMGAHRKPKE